MTEKKYFDCSKEIFPTKKFKCKKHGIIPFAIISSFPGINEYEKERYFCQICYIETLEQAAFEMELVEDNQENGP